LFTVNVSFISDGIKDNASNDFDCTRDRLIKEVYKWCKKIEENSKNGQIVIDELTVNDKEDIKEEVLILENQRFFEIGKEK
jgi:hypothetical protein